MGSFAPTLLFNALGCSDYHTRRIITTEIKHKQAVSPPLVGLGGVYSPPNCNLNEN